METRGCSRLERNAWRELGRTDHDQGLCKTVSIRILIRAAGRKCGTKGSRSPASATDRVFGTRRTSDRGGVAATDRADRLVPGCAGGPDSWSSTFPDQVAAADNWLQQNSYLTGTNLMKAVDAQPWDPSVKALTQFPIVLDNMTKNLSWTSALGEAYHTQAADVMSAIQFLRAKAKAAGNLKSGFTDHGGRAIATDDRDSIREPAGGLCSHVQPCGCLRLSRRLSQLRLRRPTPRRPRCSPSESASQWER